ncbi:hypothetical protein A7U60_g4955 [Sanghuangporus baumii]|uniref:Uncharacterized protein n=1 Tax=Sanghuangporus baumii TaxID=108892 RepID=A0A9Q5HYD9_SANBA|nr:hypothetical protein A7U60_g4955 [Sanghuangporus baumii]
MSAILRGSSRIARHVAPSSRRHFASSSAARKDIVQELYLQELRTYKPPLAVRSSSIRSLHSSLLIPYPSHPKYFRAQPKDAHVGVVKPLSIPPAPQPPSPPSDLASELAAYDAQEPTLAASSPAKAATSASLDLADDSGSGAKEFLAFLEADLPKHEAHH